MNHGGNLTSMEDLDDDTLTQILVRLPNSSTILGCSLVNKRWCSLISDPNFQFLFANHKKKTPTLLMGSGSHHDVNELPWTFVTTIVPRNGFCYIPNNDNMNRSITQFILESPKLSLEFISFNNFTATATFKDLVLLCNSHMNMTDQGGGRLYYITNPLTKQWVALPPCPLDKRQGKRIKRAALICQSTYNHARDYKFRVVVVRHPCMDQSTGTVDLVVYCSEIGEWKEINFRVYKEVEPAEPEKAEMVVCNGIIYFKSGLRLVALDPFDVHDSCDTNLEARVMPPLPCLGILLESSGQLFILHTPQRYDIDGLWYDEDARAMELSMVVWRLDPNQAHLVWETTFQGLCKGTLSSLKFPYNRIFDGIIYIYPEHIVIHPYNEKLIYMYLVPEEEFILYDMQTGCITPLKSLRNYILSKFHRLEQQWWPTSVPASAMLHSRTGVAATTD